MKNLKLTLTLGVTLLLLAGCGATSTTDKNSSDTSNQSTEAASSNLIKEKLLFIIPIIPLHL